MIASLPEKHNPDALYREFNQPASVPTDFRPSIVITAGLDGIRELRIIADESSRQEALQHALKAVEPILEQLHEALVRVLGGNTRRAEN